MGTGEKGSASNDNSANRGEKTLDGRKSNIGEGSQDDAKQRPRQASGTTSVNNGPPAPTEKLRPEK